MSALSFTRLDAVSRRNDLRVIFRPDQLSFCQSMDVTYDQTSQSTMTAACDDLLFWSKKVPQKDLIILKESKNVCNWNFKEKRMRIWTQRVTHREIHQLSMPDGTQCVRFDFDPCQKDTKTLWNTKWDFLIHDTKRVCVVSIPRWIEVADMIHVLS